MPPNDGQAADVASMAAIAAIMSAQFRRTVAHIREQAATSTALRTDVRETAAIAAARAATQQAASRDRAHSI
tara:strand:- start:7862 stop:8077 length:216 start_codon:yes stop_codon:yes gene_type:complete